MSDNNQRRNKPDSAQGMVGGGSGISENCIYKPMNVNHTNVYYSFTQHPGYL